MKTIQYLKLKIRLMYSFESDPDHIFSLADRLTCQNLIDITACKVNTMKLMD